MKIHLVEDNPDMLDSLGMLLQLRGYEVRTYLRALDVLDALDALGPDDVIVSDYYLPDMNGVELLKKAREAQPGVRALLLTGSREAGIAAAARAVENCSVLYKPSDLDSLEQGIRRLTASRP